MTEPKSSRRRRAALPRLLALVLSAVVLLTGAGQAPPEDGAGSGSDGRFDTGAIDRWVTEEATRAGYPGVAVVVTHGSRIVHLAGYGHDSTGAPVTPDSPMPIASLSKSFTALAVLQLVEDGRFALDAPVRDLLPGFAVADPRGARITVGELLEQTSGITDRTLPEKSLPQPDTLADAVARARSASLATDPGTRYAYSNTNYHLAAALVQAVTGEPFAEYLHRRVLAPLGMTATTAIDRTPAGLPPAVPDGYVYAYGRSVPAAEPDRFVAGSDGIISTARDMASWLILQNTGTGTDGGAAPVSPAGLAAMHTPSDPGRTYAMGWQTRPEGGVEHSGLWFTYAAQQILLPSGYGIAVFGNTGIGLANEGLGGLADGLARIVSGTPAEPSAAVRLPVDLVLAALTLATVVLGIRRLRRTGSWVRRFAARPVAAALRCAARLAPVVLLVVLPDVIGGLVGNGRDLTHWQLAYYSPALVVWVATAAAFGVAVPLARAATALRARTGGRSGIRAGAR